MDIDRVIQLLHEEDQIAIDTETNGLQPYHGNRLIGLSLYFPVSQANFYLPFRHETGENLPIILLEQLKEHYPLPGKTYIGHNIKFDLHMLNVDGFRRPDQVEETMLAAHLVNENEPTFALKPLSVKYLGAWAGEGEQLLQEAAEAFGIGAKTQMAFLPPDLVSPYAALDTKITWLLREFYRPVLNKWDQWDFYQSRNEYLLKFLYETEKNGMYADREEILRNMDKVEHERLEVLELLRLEAARFGNGDYNPNSPPQTLDFLRQHGYKIESTGADILEPYDRAGDHWPKQILKYRRLTKVNSSFYNPYLRFQDPNGVIHTTYHVTGTVTGRLSSSDPNIQQTPKEAKKDDPRNEVKAVFKARPGRKIVDYDYSQLELRIAIHYSNERKMRDMFLKGVDLHQYTADELTYMLGYPISRSIGKRSNFGLLYRMGGEKAALKFGIPVQDATDLVAGWRELYPEFGFAYKAYDKKAQQWRNPDGSAGGKFQYIRLDSGRIKHFHDQTRRGEPETYKAWNFVVQGTGNDIMQEAALRISRVFDGDNRVWPIYSVHDSGGWEVEEDFIPEFVPVMREIATDFPGFVVPLAIEVHVGDNWRDLETYE